MQNKDASGAPPADQSDWANAWEAVSRLAVARRLALNGHENPASIGGPAAGSLRSGSDPVLAQQIAPVDPGQLARAVAEIEMASAALRRSEPALELWRPDTATHKETRKQFSVWFLIGGIWISATVVVAGATSAILYLLG